jgi:molecular chaperone HscB
MTKLIFVTMNYFELYDIPVTLKLETASVKKKFYELSRKYHPDFHSQATEEQQLDVLRKSADVNKAYKTFQNPDETIRYVLKMKGIVQDEEKYALHASFLGDVMDINEQLMELEMNQDPIGLSNAEKDSNDLLNKIYEDVAVVIENYKEGVTTQEELLRIKDYYYMKKYLLRILDKIAQMRNIASL